MGSDGNGETAKLLRRTLSRNPHLAQMVRTLRVGTTDHKRHKEAQDHIVILKQCANVKHVEILGYNQEEVENYHHALENKRLISIKVSSSGPSLPHLNQRYRPFAGAFCGVDDLLRMMAEWPDLEILHFENTAISESLSNRSIEYCYSPRLKEVVFTHDNDLTENFFLTLATMTRVIEKLVINGSTSMECSMLDTARNIGSWSNTLRWLCLQPKQYHDHYFHFDHVHLPNLPNLEYLQTDSHIFPVSCLQGSIPRITTLDYTLQTNDMIKITSALRQSMFLPCLALLRVTIMPPDPDLYESDDDIQAPLSLAVVNSLQQVCLDRSIQLTLVPGHGAVLPGS